jgi:acetyl-CoA carboxylase biotin carboxyl carrier protein
MKMNVKEIKELISLMNENDLVELEIEKEGMRIRLKKTSPIAEGQPSIIIEKTGKTQIPDTKEEAEKVAGSATIEIKAPMVGTFYLAPSPEASAYVEVGTVIEPGTVICIIEAMKLMNEIKSEIKGKVLDILVDNAEPVEFGQPLFLIEPA